MDDQSAVFDGCCQALARLSHKSGVRFDGHDVEALGQVELGIGPVVHADVNDQTFARGCQETV